MVKFEGVNPPLKNNKNPIKIILDRELKTNLNSKIYKSSGEKIYLVVDENINNIKTIIIPEHITIIKCPVENNKLNLEYLLKKLNNGFAEVAIIAFFYFYSKDFLMSMFKNVKSEVLKKIKETEGKR